MLILTLAACLFAQQFEVATVRPSRVNIGQDGSISLDPVRLSIRNATLRRMMVEAWQIPYGQITGGPAWMSSDEFDIEARSASPVDAPESRKMLKALLTDRFHLVIQIDSKERRVYELTVAKGGPRLTPNPQGTWRFHGDLAKFAAILSTQLTIPFGNDPTRPTMATGAAVPVVDKTGIAGEIDIAIDLKPDPASDPFTVWQRALQEQLGLKLESGKGRADTLIVDRAEKPQILNQ